MKLQTKREALQKMNRMANEGQLDFGVVPKTETAS